MRGEEGGKECGCMKIERVSGRRSRNRGMPFERSFAKYR